MLGPARWPLIFRRVLLYFGIGAIDRVGSRLMCTIRGKTSNFDPLSGPMEKRQPHAWHKQREPNSVSKKARGQQ